MPAGHRPSPEEFYTQCLAGIGVLDDAGRRFTQQGDAVSALSAAWGADVLAVQAVLWERVMVAAPVPYRQYFRAADALFTGHRGVAEPDVEAQVTCADTLRLARARLLSDFDPDASAAIRALIADAAYLEALPAPTVDDIAAAAVARCQGWTPAQFAARRRQEAVDAMATAQGLRVRGETRAAIEAAYESDVLGLEAYLVESAVAAGDDTLMSVVVRWELAVAGVAQLQGLPEGFVAAVTAIRDAMAASLPEAEAERLLASLLEV